MYRFKTGFLIATPTAQGEFSMKPTILSITSIILVTLVSTALFAQTTASKKVLLVSDIDDTIKVSHILNPIKYVRSIDTTTPFTGMAQLYQLIANQNSESTQIAYLSNAPQEIKGVPVMQISHSKFLESNYFPQGELILRADIKDQNHKINSIRRLIKEQQPEVVIMIGDNGEKDVDTYLTAQSELQAQGIEFHTYIHQLYSSQSILQTGRSLLQNQIGFVTPFEIALDLQKNNLFDQKSLEWMEKEVMPYIVQEDSLKLDVGMPMTFPSFKNCSDYKMQAMPKALMSLSKKISEKCKPGLLDLFNLGE